jgi:hypothetical protein
MYECTALFAKRGYYNDGNGIVHVEDFSFLVLAFPKEWVNGFFL